MLRYFKEVITLLFSVVRNDEHDVGRIDLGKLKLDNPVPVDFKSLRRIEANCCGRLAIAPVADVELELAEIGELLVRHFKDGGHVVVVERVGHPRDLHVVGVEVGDLDGERLAHGDDDTEVVLSFANAIESCVSDARVDNLLQRV